MLKPSPEGIVYMLKAWPTPVHLWTDDAGKLRATPTGILTADAKRVLRARRAELVAYLSEAKRQEQST